MTVYADEIFLINFISSYILLYLLGKFIVKSKTKKIRLIIASSLGAIMAVVVFAAEITAVLSYSIRLLSAFIMVFAAFYERKRRIFHEILWLVCIAGMMIAAMMLIAVIAGGTTGIIVKAGIVYFRLPPEIFLPMLALSYVMVTFFMKLWERTKVKKRYLITITYGGRNITIPALFDSGNLLREPVTGRCVSLLEWDKARGLFAADYEYDALWEHADVLKLWAVPYRSIGSENGIIPAFMADIIDVHEAHKVIEKSFVGIYGGSLSKNNEYNALLNAALL